MKGKSKTGRKEARKKAVKNAHMKEFLNEVKEVERQEPQTEEPVVNKTYNVFDRFQKKIK